MGTEDSTIIRLEGINLYYVNQRTGENTVKLGEVFAKEDGYYDFWPEEFSAGYWPAYLLRAVADLLDEMNREWDEHLNKTLSDLGPVNAELDFDGV